MKGIAQSCESSKLKRSTTLRLDHPSTLARVSSRQSILISSGELYEMIGHRFPTTEAFQSCHHSLHRDMFFGQVAKAFELVQVMQLLTGAKRGLTRRDWQQFFCSQRRGCWELAWPYDTYPLIFFYLTWN